MTDKQQETERFMLDFPYAPIADLSVGLTEDDRLLPMIRHTGVLPADQGVLLRCAVIVLNGTPQLAVEVQSTGGSFLRFRIGPEAVTWIQLAAAAGGFAIRRSETEILIIPAPAPLPEFFRSVVPDLLASPKPKLIRGKERLDEQRGQL